MWVEQRNYKLVARPWPNCLIFPSGGAERNRWEVWKNPNGRPNPASERNRCQHGDPPRSRDGAVTTPRRHHADNPAWPSARWIPGQYMSPSELMKIVFLRDQLWFCEAVSLLSALFLLASYCYRFIFNVVFLTVTPNGECLSSWRILGWRDGRQRRLNNIKQLFIIRWRFFSFSAIISLATPAQTEIWYDTTANWGKSL